MRIMPLVIGHRGASAVAPENTLAAFASAIEAKADGVEFDVRLSRDGVPVIIHDETLWRTAGVASRVGEMPAAELQQVNVGSWFSRGRKLRADLFATETVPTLQQLFDLFRPNNALLYLEMKCEPAQRTELAAACCQLVRGNSFVDRVIAESFDLAGIEAVKNIDPAIRTAALFEPKLSARHLFLSGERIADQARAAGADEVALHHKLASRRIIERVQLAGLKVVVWTVDDPEWIPRSQTLGIDALITNDPAKLLHQRDKS